MSLPQQLLSNLTELLLSANDHDSDEDDDSYKGVAVGLGSAYLLVIFLTYTFQYIRLLRTGSVVGINPYFMILGNLSSVASLLNSLIFYFVVIHECFDIVLIDCINRMLGLYQIAAQYLCFMIFYAMFVYYSRRQVSAVATLADAKSAISPLASINYQAIGGSYDRSHSSHCCRTPSNCCRGQGRRGWVPLQLGLVLLVNAILVTITVVLLSTDDWMGYQQMTTYGRVLGGVSTVAVMIQYLSQIYSLYQTKYAHNFGVTTYIMLCCGNLTSFLYLMVSTAVSHGRADVSTWLPYLVCFLLQLVLVIQIIYYNRRNRGLYSTSTAGAIIQYDQSDSDLEGA